MDGDILHLIFQRVQEKVLRRGEEERHAAGRHQRRAVDALRSRIKRLEPPVRPGDTWDQVRPRVEKLEEYRAIESDELRESAFDKVIRRMKEKEEDADRDRESRDRDRPSRRDYYDRDRDHRSYRERRGPPSRHSRSPEPDAYEADRRKAQADRERSYKKFSGFSPSDRRDERDRDRERYRERDYERERLYRTRGDPRGGRDELDYGGDTRSTTSNDRRRRRDSDSESVASRSAKRYRRDSRERERSREPRRDRERTTPPVLEEAKQEEKAVHSGSEEGEIEED